MPKQDSTLLLATIKLTPSFKPITQVEDVNSSVPGTQKRDLDIKKWLLLTTCRANTFFLGKSMSF